MSRSLKPLALPVDCRVLPALDSLASLKMFYCYRKCIIAHMFVPFHTRLCHFHSPCASSRSLLAALEFVLRSAALSRISGETLDLSPVFFAVCFVRAILVLSH